jgi:putative ABC transport system permease protein
MRASSVQRLGSIAVIGCRSLARHKLRSALTALGLVIGVGCVVVVVAISRGAAKQVEDSFAFLGTNYMFVVPGATARNGVRLAAQTNFTLDDVDAIRAECPAVAYVSPQTATGVQIIAGSMNWSTSIRGVNAEWPLVRTWPIAEGTFFTEAESRSDFKICVLGSTVAENLFPDGNAVGSMVRIRNVPFKVVGVLKSKGANRNGDNQDDFALAPFVTVATRLVGNRRPNSIVLAAIDADHVDEAWDQIDALLRQRHKIPPGSDPDFTIHSQVEMAAASVESMKTLGMLLLSIAAVSLVVGGIGIMNIMLVSVTERTREIGIRMAVGAKSRHVLTQFLFEAVMISAIGGLTGVLIGIAVSRLIATNAGWPIIVSADSVALAFSVAAFVGIFFGFYPARKASRLDPIDALRYE